MTGHERTTGPGRPSNTLEPWDDDRLAAAFSERYDRIPPHELVVATLVRLGETRRRPGWWPWADRAARGRLVAATGLAVVVVLIGVAVLPRASTGPTATATTGSTPTIARSDGTPYESVEPSPAVAGFAATVGDLPVRSVADASTLLADPALGDTELAFAGWYSASDLALPCPYQGPPASPIEIRCGDVRAGLASTAAPIFSADGTAIAGRADPAEVVPLQFVPPVDPLPGTSGPRSAMATTPQRIILIGHFHDERATRCPADERATCERTFVVDGTANVYGTLAHPYESSHAPTEATHLTAAQAANIARLRIFGDRVSGGYGTILSVGLQHGTDAPWFTAAQNADCLCPPTWFVRGYRVLLDGGADPRAPGTPVAGWLTVDDATGAVAGTMLIDVPVPATPFPYASAPAGFPATVGGLPVRTVADVVDPDRPRDDIGAPVAVAGWFTQLPIHPCPSIAAGVDTCNRETIVLAGTDKRLVTYGAGGFATVVPADGPVLNPVIVPGGASQPADRDGAPMPVVFIVHAGDRRTVVQGPNGPVGADTFVLDQVAWLDGGLQPPTVWIAPGLTPTRSATRILDEALDGKFMNPGTWVTSMSAVARRDLASVGMANVTLSPTDDPNAIVWVVRMVGQPPGTGEFGVSDGYGWAVIDDATLTEEGGWTSP